MFVNGCHLVCKPIIELQEVEEAQKLFASFCIQFEAKYGDQFLVPNLHMLLHIKDSILDFGPVYSFWCFGFERWMHNIKILSKLSIRLAYWEQ